MNKSTKNIIKMHGWRIDRALHNYIYFTQYDRYVSLALKFGNMVSRGPRLFSPLGKVVDSVFQRYHAKLIMPEDIKKMLTLEESVIVDRGKTEKLIPFKYANDIILKEPDFIAVMDCPCRLARGESACQPVNVCMAIGRTTAEFWLDHGRKYNARKVTQKEALEMIANARDRGDIITSWFKVATGGRTGVICACCSCCCGALEVMRVAKSLKGHGDLTNLAHSGYSVEFDEEKCTFCKACVGNCFMSANKIDNNGAIIFDESLCLGCGVCAEKCPSGARVMVRSPHRGIPLDMDYVKENLL